MKTRDDNTEGPGFIIRMFQALGNAITAIGRYALFVAMVLVGIWVVGRGFEAISHNTVFEPHLIYWFGFSIWVLLGAFIFGASIHYLRQVLPHFKDHKLIFSWLFFGLIVAAIAYTVKSYEIAASGLFATAAGLTESAQQSLFLLFKSYPAAPVLPVNVFAAKIAGMGLDMDALGPFVLGSPYIFAFLVWSLVYGALLLRIPGQQFFKVMHLSLASAGLIFMMMVKAKSAFTNYELLFLQIGVVGLIFLQVLLTYSSLRTAAEETNDEHAGNPEPTPLPPSAFKVALFLLFLLPIFTDLHNQYTLASNSKPIIEELAKLELHDQNQYMTAAQISIHSGPAVGDEIVGVLPKGTRVPALDEKEGWVCIGQNKWVPVKYLSPAQTG